MAAKEKTSKKVASKASSVMLQIDITLAELKQCQRVISDAIVLLEKAKSVAASALTQREK